MKSYIIEGGRRLEGTVEISGSKNASLPIIAATVLCDGETKLYNVPNIYDTKITLDILKYLGCKIRKNSGKIDINSTTIKTTKIPGELMHQMRSTVVLAGALLGRFKRVTFSYPGGCDIGARPIDLHIEAFRKLGINVEEVGGSIKCSCEKIVGTDINLDFPSVGATENIILAAVCAEGTTIINNAAMEPEIVDLANFLNKMGANIQGAGLNIVKIVGIKKLKSVSYNIMPDRIEAGTFLCATAITGGKVLLKNAYSEHLVPVIFKLEEMGCNIVTEKRDIVLNAPKKLKGVQIKTLPYPGFPTDLQQIFGAMMSVAKGSSVIIENIFENRFKYLAELKKMGAKNTIEGKMAVIIGVKRLLGADVDGCDLRGGAALVVAGLSAKGRTTIKNIEYILRGYEKFDVKLNKLGASIIVKEGG